MRKIGVFPVVGVLMCLVCSCMRVEDVLFEPEQTDFYQFDDYKGKTDFTLGSYFDIPEEKIHLVQMTSNLNGDEAKIYATYVGDLETISTDTVIVYCHGNHMHMDYYWPRTKLLANTGYGVLTFDYRGYGKSEGQATEEGLYADTRAVLQWLKERGLTDDRLVIYGFSLGSAPATKLSAHPQVLTPSKLILEAPFASAEAFVRDAVQLSLPASYITNLEINNADEIKKVQQPLLWMHGTEDRLLHIEAHGELVYNNHNGAFKEGYRVEGAWHQSVPIDMEFINYVYTIQGFVRRNNK
ncbi:alpha/beta fold hydrolase [Cytophagaceae bacterium ABcell3]|nr:alpha/beta fold hydrolase [Cytophagaceae bacterium ABcell3]